MNDKEMSESSGNEADVSEMGEESIDERNKLHTSEEARKPYTLTLAPETVHLVWKYSKVPVCGMLEHWSDVLKKNPPVAANPRFGQAWFTDCTIIQSPVYEKMLARVREGAMLLELGCVFGQNIRRLAEEGARHSNLFGFDMNEYLIEAGYDLFQDRGRTPMAFFSGDILAASPTVELLIDRFNIVFANMFFHHFPWTEQVTIAKRVFTLLRNEPGAMIFGQQIGRMKPGLVSVRRKDGQEGYAHNTISLQQMWDFIGSHTESKWHVQGIMEVNRDIAAFTEDDDARCLRFWIRRI